MSDLNKERIFNESSKKVYAREYENLSKDYTKMNALKYYDMYSRDSLSCILESSRYIFAEPMKGLQFYKNIVEHETIPFYRMEEEYEKVNTYYTENVNRMSQEQKESYKELLESVEDMVSKYKNSIRIYNYITENATAMDKYYDALYEYHKSKDEFFMDELKEFMENFSNDNIMDAIHLSVNIPELNSYLYKVCESSYYESPQTPDEFALNTYTSNVLSRMLSDNIVKESVSNIPNVNTRHIILGLSGFDENDSMEYLTTEKVSDFELEHDSPNDLINSIFEESFYQSERKVTGDACEKENRLFAEKAVLEMSLAFAIADQMTSDDDYVRRNSLVDRICFESTEIEKAPNTYEEQVTLLESRLKEVNSQIDFIEEKFFSNDGSPSAIISKSVGETGEDEKMSKKSKKDEDDDTDTEEESEKAYVPLAKKSKHTSHIVNSHDEDDENVTEASDPRKEEINKKNTEIDSMLEELKKLATEKKAKMASHDTEAVDQIERKQKEYQKKIHEYREDIEKLKDEILSSKVSDSDSHSGSMRYYEPTHRTAYSRFAYASADDLEDGDSILEKEFDELMDMINESVDNVSRLTSLIDEYKKKIESIKKEIESVKKDTSATGNKALENLRIQEHNLVLKAEELEKKLARAKESDDKNNSSSEPSHKWRSSRVSRSRFAYASADDLEDGDAIIEKKEESTAESKAKYHYEEIEEPEKRPFFQRVQNKALDANVKFKKKVAEGRRNAQDARNAGKAVAKIPTNVSDSIKKTVDEWDELDDNRRKEYIIKPGFRKKYFRALKLCIMHYGAFAINPILNIVLFICQKFSHDKDIRIRNEIIRELKAEIRVTEEKIEDAKSNGDNQQKYKLMRIKEKLDAELTRVTLNTKVI